MAGAYAWRGQDYERSFHEAEAAVEMAPLDTETQSTASYYATNAGRLDKGIEWASWAVAHNVHNDLFVKGNLAWAYYAAGRNDEAVEVFKGLEASYPCARQQPNTRESFAGWKKPGPIVGRVY